MNIGIFTNNYLPRVTGVARSVESFSKELEKRGHKVYIFAPKYYSKHEEKEVFHFPSLRVSNKLGRNYLIPPVPITYSLKIKKVIKELDLDIIHSQHPYLLGKTARRYARELGIPLIFTNHTPHHQFLNPLPTDLNDFLKPYLVSLVVNYANKSQLVIVPTSGMKKLLLGEGVKTPIEVVPSGISIAHFRGKSGLEVRKKYRLKKDDTLLLLVSRLSYEKNIGFLLEIFQNLLQKRNNLYLMIVGDGLKRRSLEDTVLSLGIKKRVIFVGQVDYQQLPYYYKAGDIFVYPSLVDSQALVLVEAMASGLPIIALKDAIGPRNIVLNGKTGFLVANSQKRFTEAVLKLIDNFSLRREFSRNTEEEVQNYSIQRSTNKLVQAYQKVI